MLFLTDPKDAIDDLFTDVLRYQLDGIIITSAAATHDLYQSKTDFPIPAVLYNGYVPGLSISAVHSDNYAGCIQMADYLVSLRTSQFSLISRLQIVLIAVMQCVKKPFAWAIDAWDSQL